MTAAATLDRRPFVVGVGGSTRPGSSTERALRVGLDAAAAAGADTLLPAAKDLVLPMYEVTGDRRTPAAARMVAALARADGVLTGAIADVSADEQLRLVGEQVVELAGLRAGQRPGTRICLAGRSRHRRELHREARRPRPEARMRSGPPRSASGEFQRRDSR
jgi:hypothetical protein